MNRCPSSPSPTALAWRIGLFAALFSFFTLAAAQESVRNFPPTAVRAIMQITNPPEVLMNGQIARLAPGARIRGVNNMLVVSGAFAGQTLVVNYVRGALGLVQDVWVLNATEAQLPMTGDVPRINYVSGYAPAPADGAASAVSPATPYLK